jgi:uncharacterized protein with NRDE domain
MCLIALAIGTSARWPLVIAANRDEHRLRPTQPLTTWSTDAGDTLMSGRDLRAGGTWLGSTAGGRVAMLTNVREAEPTTGRLSRGDLPLHWLTGRMDADAFWAQHDPAAYGGCNLVIGDFLSGQWAWASNRASNTTRWQTRLLSPGIYGLSNALLDTPWPKTLALKVAMQTALARAQSSGDEADLSQPLWAALAKRERAPLAGLPQTGVPTELEHALSSAHVDIPERDYGTRCSTLMWIDSSAGPENLKGTLWEKTMGGDATRLQWALNA